MASSGRMSTGRFNARRSFWSHTSNAKGPQTAATSRSGADQMNNQTRSTGIIQNASSRARENVDYIKATLLGRYGSGMGSVSSRKPPRARSATNLQAISPTPSHSRDTEDIMEEIFRLKRQIQSVNNENSMLKTKLRKLEMDLGKKDKELEDLLDPEAASSFSGGSKETGKGVQQRLLMQSLKQKIVRLEQAVRGKDAALNALKSELKSTRLEELRIQSETMYHEILRLRQSTKDTVAEDPAQEVQNRMKAMQETILRLNESNQKLLEENKKLHEKSTGGIFGRNQSKKMESKMEVGGEIAGAEGSYTGMKRTQLIAVIRKLEKQLANRDHEYLKNAHNGNTEDKEKISELEKENKRLSEMVLRQQREENKLEKELEQKETDINHLQRQNEQLKNEVHRLEKEGASKNTNSLNMNNVSKSQQPKDDHVTNNSKSHEKPRTKPRSSVSNGHQENTVKPRHDPAKVENFRRNKAAKTIQNHWKRYQDDKEDALETLDSALRAHSNRRSKLTNGQRREQSADSSSLDSDVFLQQSKLANGPVSKSGQRHEKDDEDLSEIGAAIRGHSTRKNMGIKSDQKTSDDDSDHVVTGHMTDDRRSDQSGRREGNLGKSNRHDEEDFYR